MIQLTGVSARGFKGREFSYPVSPRMGITGPNGVGKSAIIESVVLAITGYVPSMGKQLAAVRHAFSENDPSVGLRLSRDGEDVTVERTFRVDEAGSVKTAAVKVFPPSHEKPEAAIATMLGHFPVMFDVNEFLALSSDKKREWLFALCPPDKEAWTKEAVVQKLQDGLTVSSSEATAAQVDEWVAGLIQNLLSRWRVGMEAQIALPLIHAEVKERIKTQKQEAVRAAATLERLGQQVAEIQGARNAPRIREELATVERDYEAVVQQIATVEAKREEQARVHIDAHTDSTVSPEMLVLEDVKALLKGTDPVLHRQDEWQTLTAEGQAAVAELDLVVRPRRTSLTAEIATCRVRMDKIGLASDTCPVCLRPGFDAEQVKADTEDQMTETLREDASLRIREADLVMEDRRCTVGLQQIEKERAGFVKLAEKRDRLQETVESKKKYETDRRLAAQKRLSEIGTLPNVGLLRSQKDELSAHLARIKADLDVVSRAKGLAVEREKAKQDKITAQVQVDALKELDARVGPRGILGEMALSQVGGVLKDVNRILVPALGRQMYISTIKPSGGETFEMKVYKGDPETGIEISAMSHGEQSVVAVAIVVAFIRKRAPEWKALLIDHVESIDSENRKALFTALSLLDDFANVIVAGHTDVKEWPDGWSLIVPGSD